MLNILPPLESGFAKRKISYNNFIAKPGRNLDKMLQVISGKVNNDNILPNLIFYSELVIHWALCNNVNVGDGSLGAIATLRTISSLHGKYDNSHFATKTTIGARDAFLSAGGWVGLERSKADAIVADICWDAIFIADEIMCKQRWQSLYNHFLLKCAYLIGTRQTMMSPIGAPEKTADLF